MNWDEMHSAVEDAERTLRLADQAANKLARLLVGRLRKVEYKYTLAALKRELRGFDLRTNTWN